MDLASISCPVAARQSRCPCELEAWPPFALFLIWEISAAAAVSCCPPEIPKPVIREAAHVFPNVDLAGAFAVPTCQHSDVDLVRTGDAIEQEKDRLLERV